MCLPSLIADAQSGAYDAVLHVGCVESRRAAGRPAGLRLRRLAPQAKPTSASLSHSPPPTLPLKLCHPDASHYFSQRLGWVPARAGLALSSPLPLLHTIPHPHPLLAAYNFEQGSPVSSVGNNFMNAIQPYAAIKPVQVAAGNHEACPSCVASASLPQSDGNFTQYRARLHSVSLFSNTGNNIYYSFNQGLVHFIVFSAEAYLYARSADFIANQVNFMKADLAAVDRSATPWVVALVHKDWTMEPEAFADFYPVIEAGGVDILFCGHVHYYSRFYPYDAPSQKIDTASVSGPLNNQVYTNPKYLVNIITGASGDREKDSKCPKGTPVPPEITCTQSASASSRRWSSLWFAGELTPVTPSRAQTTATATSRRSTRRRRRGPSRRSSRTARPVPTRTR